MLLLEGVLAAQVSQQGESGNTPASSFLVIAVVAIVLAIVLLIFIRTTLHKSSKE